MPKAIDRPLLLLSGPLTSPWTEVLITHLLLCPSTSLIIVVPSSFIADSLPFLVVRCRPSPSSSDCLLGEVTCRTDILREELSTRLCHNQSTSSSILSFIARYPISASATQRNQPHTFIVHRSIFATTSSLYNLVTCPHLLQLASLLVRSICSLVVSL